MKAILNFYRATNDQLEKQSTENKQALERIADNARISKIQYLVKKSA